MEAAVIPFPNPESTPPVTNTNLVGLFATLKVPSHAFNFSNTNTSPLYPKTPKSLCFLEKKYFATDMDFKGVASNAPLSSHACRVQHLLG